VVLLMIESGLVGYEAVVLLMIEPVGFDEAVVSTVAGVAPRQRDRWPRALGIAGEHTHQMSARGLRIRRHRCSPAVKPVGSRGDCRHDGRPLGWDVDSSAKSFRLGPGLVLGLFLGGVRSSRRSWGYVKRHRGQLLICPDATNIPDRA
jgi:hypothetical protein